MHYSLTLRYIRARLKVVKTINTQLNSVEPEGVNVISTFTKSLLTLFSALLLIGCAGTRTFHELAMPGDTVAVAAGYRHHFQRDNITVTITDADGATTVYDPGEIHPDSGNIAVRAVINFYPDPMSSWVVSDRTGTNQTPNALTYVGQNLFQNTEGDYDWWQTVVFVDLPVAMATGDATILIETPAGLNHETYTSAVNIVPGAGQAHNFDAITKVFGVNFALENQHLQVMERVPHATLDLSGSTVPYAIQVDLSHNPDQDNGGLAGDKAYISNPVGHIKSVSWNDNGVSTRIIMMPNRDSDITDFKDFKLYLAGVGGWTVVDIQAFDQDGRTDGLGDVSATVNP